MAAPRVVSLFSGAGGMDLGFTLAGFNPIFANDIDPVALDSYRSWMDLAREQLPHLNASNHRLVPGDITQVDDLPGEGDAEIVIGGPPCQGFSVAGKMNPDDPRSRQVWNFLAVVNRVKPKAFVMENVQALAVNKRWAGLREDLLRESDSLGYATSLFVLNASHFNAPQSRLRMFLVGIEKPGDPMPAPSPITADNPPTLREAVKTVPQWNTPGNDTICTARVTPAKKPVLRRSPFAGMLFNGQGRPMDLERPAPTLPASMGGNRTPIIDQDQLAQGSSNWIVDYHRQLLDGGSTVSAVPNRMRRITVEEAAAIQTFPPSMNWSGKQSARYRQIGNAVPPVLAYHVANALRKALRYPDFRPPDQFLGLGVS
ncbi:DNA (cytosine-5)-methyltransferase 1 [Brevibacterium sp. 239c]|uniref:DNA cytosine methyltransferase n=1 Tax=Brevibacterium sp. 239c TaxID=1965356 RepID=UPI000C39D46C|nr:DNA cytosine methyltransferase [Brevibacterium sp. 239c]SMX72818.1 DNA (cytosine-5)-methyltransferase 1 [Brevibacterium sp. 239c]